jgi:AraC family transcriptional regulator of adaptative response / DNA-3-methyladenine glycosylase II
MPDDEHCLRAVHSKDNRFDGWFFTAVTSTGIYCRPSCPAMVPKREHMRFYPTSAAAQVAGFRACKRCRPDATPGSPEWDLRADLVGRAMRLIADGVVDRDGVAGLARRLDYSERHLNRMLRTEVGAGPIALARAQRAQTARVLIETTALPFSNVAFAAGFASIRQFNDTVKAVFATTPTELRRRAARRKGAEVTTAAGAITVRLPYRGPLDLAGLFGFLALRAVPGVEEGDLTRYRRTLALPHGAGIVELTPADGHIRCALRLEDLRDVATAVARCRRLLGLDADPVAVDALLGTDPVLAPLVTANPGRRVPGHVDGSELAVRAVLGQQVSVAAARNLAGRLAHEIGEPVPIDDPTLTRLFPSSAALAGVDPAGLPMPRSRARAIHELAAVLAAGEVVLDPGADRRAVADRLLALPGIGPWTVEYIAMRALGDPDAFLPTDLGVRHGLRDLGLSDDPASISVRAERWRPWRASAVLHLWALPPAGPPPDRTTPILARTT